MVKSYLCIAAFCYYPKKETDNIYGLKLYTRCIETGDNIKSFKPPYIPSVCDEVENVIFSRQ